MHNLAFDQRPAAPEYPRVLCTLHHIILGY
eukprot:SAG25_NODE_13102_length_271_cov_0.633721_1_plen_29_part_10